MELSKFSCFVQLRRIITKSVSSLVPSMPEARPSFASISHWNSSGIGFSETFYSRLIIKARRRKTFHSDEKLH